MHRNTNHLITHLLRKELLIKVLTHRIKILCEEKKEHRVIAGTDCSDRGHVDNIFTMAGQDVLGSVCFLTSSRQRRSEKISEYRKEPAEKLRGPMA